MIEIPTKVSDRKKRTYKREINCKKENFVLALIPLVARMNSLHILIETINLTGETCGTELNSLKA